MYALDSLVLRTLLKRLWATPDSTSLSPRRGCWHWQLLLCMYSSSYSSSEAMLVQLLWSPVSLGDLEGTTVPHWQLLGYMFRLRCQVIYFVKSPLCNWVDLLTKWKGSVIKQCTWWLGPSSCQMSDIISRANDHITQNSRLGSSVAVRSRYPTFTPWSTGLVTVMVLESV
jgi:hypothetical protein